MSRTLRLGAGSIVATAVAVLGFAGAAGAHVSVNPDTASAGGSVRIAFLVPDESTTASTVKLDVQIPTDKPIPSVKVEPVPGWTVTVKTTKLANPVKTDEGDMITDVVSQLTWTANAPANGIQPNQFQEFPVALEGLPDTDAIAFKAVQTYSDGTVVRWIDDTVAGQPEPEHPAPVLSLGKPGVATASGGTVVSTAKSSATTPRKPDPTTLALALIAVALGLLAAALGMLAFTRSRGAARRKSGEDDGLS